MPKRERSPATPEALIRKIVATQLAPPDFNDIVGEGPAAELWPLLSAAFEAQAPPHLRKDALTLEQWCDLEKKLHAGLSPELDVDFGRLIQAQELKGQAELEAAFALGFAFGRAMAGGAR